MPFDRFKRFIRGVLGPDADIAVPVLNSEHAHFMCDPAGKPDMRVLVYTDRH